MGALVAPLMIEPFLYEEEVDMANQRIQLESLNSTLTAVQYRIYYPFGIGSIVMWISSAAFLIMYLSRPTNFDDSQDAEPDVTTKPRVRK